MFTSAEAEGEIVRLRKANPHWVHARSHTQVQHAGAPHVPTLSAIEHVLQRISLVTPRRSLRAVPASRFGSPPGDSTAASPVAVEAVHPPCQPQAYVTATGYRLCHVLLIERTVEGSPQHAAHLSRMTARITVVVSRPVVRIP
jgi:hypothetical protein